MGFDEEMLEENDPGKLAERCQTSKRFPYKDVFLDVGVMMALFNSGGNSSFAKRSN